MNQPLASFRLIRHVRHEFIRGLVLVLLVFAVQRAAAENAPVLETVFPAGASAGTTTEVTLNGTHLENLKSLHTSIPSASIKLIEGGRASITVPENVLPGFYDLQAVSETGISNVRTFAVSRFPEIMETEPNDQKENANIVASASSRFRTVINGRINTPGDRDSFSFTADAGSRIVFDCIAERIDSRLRAVLEIIDSSGKQVAVNRGLYGSDPLIDFVVPSSGQFVVRVQDLVSSSSADHYYRLEIDQGPRVAFVFPDAVQAGKDSEVSLVGWNLSRPNQEASPRASGVITKSSGAAEFETTVMKISASEAVPSSRLSSLVAPTQAGLSSIAVGVPNTNTICHVNLTDAPVVCVPPPPAGSEDSSSATSALQVTVPVDICGQLSRLNRDHWFRLTARRGEVFSFDVLADRIGSPLDPEITVFDSTGTRRLIQFSDAVQNPAGAKLPLNHLDATGEWTAPSDGDYLIQLRNLSGGPVDDPRRIYRMKLRRRESSLQVLALPRSDSVAGLNLAAGDTTVLDLYALRSEAMNESVRVRALDLPSGISCPDVWFGPQSDHATLTISAVPGRSSEVTELKLEACAVDSNNSVDSNDSEVFRCLVRGATALRGGRPIGRARLTDRMTLMITGAASSTSVSLQASVDSELQHHLYGKLLLRYSPGSVLDIKVQASSTGTQLSAPIYLTADGLTPLIQQQTAEIPAGHSTGHLSFYLPPGLPSGHYSLVIRGTTSVPTSDQKTTAIQLFSNVVSFEVTEPAFLVSIDPFAPRKARRGETIQIAYRAERRNGFIGKMHTELAVPGIVTDVPGIRGRGETFTGQSDTGSLQIVVNDDAPLGKQPFLRFFTVGVIEDEPTWFGGSFVDLEIVE